MMLFRGDHFVDLVPRMTERSSARKQRCRVTDDATTTGKMFGRIVYLLQQHAPRAVPILTVAEGLGIDRKAAAKHHELRAASGDMSMERFGQKKLYRSSQRLPLRSRARKYH
jgi:hypothetical protein